MEKDIAPELLELLEKCFDEKVEENIKIPPLLKAIHDGKATYIEAEDYAFEIGSSLAAVFRENLSSDILPDGRMYYNIADRVVRPMLEAEYALAANAAVQVQTSMNQKAGIGIKAQQIEVNENRIQGIIDRVSAADFYDEVAWILGEPVVNLCQSAVDEVLKANVEFQGRAGLRPRIIRRAERKCCKWCSRLAGEYNYPNLPHEVYQRHENCRCTVDYDPGDGKRYQNVHTKKWQTAEERAKIEARKKLDLFSEQNRRYEADILVGKDLGAKTKDVLVMLPNGEEVRLTPGSRITKVQIIAGLGREREIDIADVLEYKYPGTKADRWQKKKGMGFVDFEGESYRAELHWYEEPAVGRVEFKVKPDRDGNWFYEGE